MGELMKRRGFIAGIGAVVATPLAVRAQQTKKLWRIAYIGPGRPDNPAAIAFRKTLAEAGYEDGRNISLNLHVVAPQLAAVEEVIPKLAANIDLLVATSTIGAVTAKRLVPTLPTVFVAVGAPVEIGLVESLSHPGGNMTGVTFEVAIETWGKRLELLKEILPDLDRVAVLMAARDPNSIYAMKSLEPWGPQLGVVLWPIIEVDAAEGLEQAFAEIARNQIRALLVIGGALIFANRKRVAELALRHRLPSCGKFRETVELGGLASISPSFSELGEIGARITAKIIEGSSPRDIPVQQPTRYQVHLNYRAGARPDDPAFAARPCRRRDRIGAFFGRHVCCACSGPDLAHLVHGDIADRQVRL
jgi:putative tryptophan/tyrosine transport system substrate-binding protein